MIRSEASHSANYRVLNAMTILYVASVPFDILPVSNGRTITAPLGIALVFAWIFDSLRRRERAPLPAAAGTLLFLYGVWITLTTFWSVNVGASMMALSTFLIQFVLVVVLSDTLRRVWLKSLITLGSSTFALGLIVLTRPADALRQGRANVGGVDENITAMILAIGFAALVYAVTYLGGRRSFLLAIPAAVTGAAVLHTGSRTGAVAVGAVVTVAILPLFRRKYARPATWFRVLILIALAYFAFKSARDAGLLPQRVMELLSLNYQQDDAGRGVIIDLYRQTFDHWAMFGVGIGNDAQYLNATESVALNAHSLFWKTWIETGLVGLVLLGAFFVTVVRHGFRTAAPQALLLIAVPIVIFAITLGGDSTSVFWFTIALALTRQVPLNPPETAQIQTPIDITRGSKRAFRQ